MIYMILEDFMKSTIPGDEEEEQHLIGKYTPVHGPSATVKEFRKTHPHLKFGESTARSIRAKYQELLESKTAGELASIPQFK